MYGHSWVSSCTEDVDKLEAPREKGAARGLDGPPRHVENSPAVCILWKRDLLIGISKRYTWENAGCMGMGSTKVGSCGEHGEKGRDQGVQAERHTREFGPEGSGESVKVSIQQQPT